MFRVPIIIFAFAFFAASRPRCLSILLTPTPMHLARHTRLRHDLRVGVDGG